MGNTPKRLPPMIYSGDIVRIESAHPYMREADMLQQVMHGEETDRDKSYKDKRYIAFDCCYGATADQVTELYRFVKTECGASYKLIWHRQPTGTPSALRYMLAAGPCYSEPARKEIDEVGKCRYNASKKCLLLQRRTP